MEAGGVGCVGNVLTVEGSGGVSEVFLSRVIDAVAGSEAGVEDAIDDVQEVSFSSD